MALGRKSDPVLNAITAQKVIEGLSEAQLRDVLSPDYSEEGLLFPWRSLAVSEANRRQAVEDMPKEPLPASDMRNEALAALMRGAPTRPPMNMPPPMVQTPMVQMRHGSASEILEAYVKGAKKNKLSPGSLVAGHDAAKLGSPEKRIPLSLVMALLEKKQDEQVVHKGIAPRALVKLPSSSKSFARAPVGSPMPEVDDKNESLLALLKALSPSDVGKRKEKETIFAKEGSDGRPVWGSIRQARKEKKAAQDMLNTERSLEDILIRQAEAEKRAVDLLNASQALIPHSQKQTVEPSVLSKVLDHLRGGRERDKKRIEALPPLYTEALKGAASSETTSKVDDGAIEEEVKSGRYGIYPKTNVAAKARQHVPHHLRALSPWGVYSPRISQPPKEVFRSGSSSPQVSGEVVSTIDPNNKGIVSDLSGGYDLSGGREPAPSTVSDISTAEKTTDKVVVPAAVRKAPLTGLDSKVSQDTISVDPTTSKLQKTILDYKKRATNIEKDTAAKLKKSSERYLTQRDEIRKQQEKLINRIAKPYSGKIDTIRDRKNRLLENVEKMKKSGIHFLVAAARVGAAMKGQTLLDSIGTAFLGYSEGDEIRDKKVSNLMNEVEAAQIKMWGIEAEKDKLESDAKKSFLKAKEADLKGEYERATAEIKRIVESEKEIAKLDIKSAEVAYSARLAAMNASGARGALVQNIYDKLRADPRNENKSDADLIMIAARISFPPGSRSFSGDRFQADQNKLKSEVYGKIAGLSSTWDEQSFGQYKKFIERAMGDLGGQIPEEGLTQASFLKDKGKDFDKVADLAASEYVKSIYGNSRGGDSPGSDITVTPAKRN